MSTCLTVMQPSPQVITGAGPGVAAAAGPRGCCRSRSGATVGRWSTHEQRCSPGPGPSPPSGAARAATRCSSRGTSPTSPTRTSSRRDATDVAGAVLAHRRLAASREPGTSLVRVFTPTVAEDGWTTPHTVVQVVTDDMPFLVDSVTNELSRAGRGIHLVVHPQVVVRRDADGSLLEVLEVTHGETDPGSVSDHVLVESWISVEIDRTAPGAGAGPPARPRTATAAPRRTTRTPRLARALLQVLADVRAAVEDWPAMQARARALAEEVEALPARLPEGGPGPGGRGRGGPAAALARRRALHVPRLPRVRAAPGRHRRHRGAGVAARHRAGHRARPRRPPDRQPAERRRHRPRPPPRRPRPHQGQQPRHRPPLDLPGLRRRQGLRRAGRGGGGAALPRPAQLGRLHPERVLGARRRPQGGRGARHQRLRPAQPLRQGPADHPRDLPARRAVRRRRGDPHPDQPRGAPAAGAAPHPPVRPPRRLRPVRLVPGLPAARPLHDRGPPRHAGGAARGVRRHRGRALRPGVGVGAGAAALRRAPGQPRRAPRRRPRRGRAAPGLGHPDLGGGPGRRPGRPARRGRGRPDEPALGLGAARGLQGGRRAPRGRRRPGPPRAARAGPRRRPGPRPAAVHPGRAPRPGSRGSSCTGRSRSGCPRCCPSSTTSASRSSTSGRTT